MYRGIASISNVSITQFALSSGSWNAQCLEFEDQTTDTTIGRQDDIWGLFCIAFRDGRGTLVTATKLVEAHLTLLMLAVCRPTGPGGRALQVE